MIYQDALITIEQPEKGSVDGHLIIKPVQAVDHLSELDDTALAQFTSAANFAATVLFETLGAQGSNIIINEEPLRCDVIARSQDDSWNHAWAPQKIEENQMGKAAEDISFHVPLDGLAEEVDAAQEPTTAPTIEELEEQESYMVRQLYRVP